MNAEMACHCAQILENACASMPSLSSALYPNEDSESGRIIYTISILLMFATVILLLMVRTIRRENSEIEMENLLDAMRFREELEFQRRQKRRLLKTKRKVADWLTKTHSNEPHKYWHSRSHLIVAKSNTSNSTPYIPQIVVTPNSDEALSIVNVCRPRTPALSLMYDFENSGRSTPRSAQSELYLNRDLSNVDFSEPPAIDVTSNGRTAFEANSQHSSLQTLDRQRSDSDSVSSISC